MTEMRTEIQVLRPQLPRVDALLPYLRRIDASRVYSNQGPLSLEFERRIAAELRIPPGSFVSAASGTAALEAAILATAGAASPQRPLALIPAFTFIATAAAVERCGYTPYLVDAHPATWAIDAEALQQHPKLDEVGVVVPVAPFGRPLNQQAWRAFRDRTSIPVVFDGAASFDVSSGGDFLGEIPLALSFNATKAFATGEGGGIASTDAECIARVRRASNFGFFQTRECRSESLNGKMSEYHAAVGLAELDGWVEKRAALQSVVTRYRDAAAVEGISEQIVAHPDVSLSYVLFSALHNQEAADVEAALQREAIGSRRWYGFGLHNEPHYRNVEHDDLIVTDSFAARVLGIPLAPDLGERAVARILATIGRARST